MANDYRVAREGTGGERELICTLEEPEKTAFWPALVRDVGPNGLALYAASPFRRGALLQAHVLHVPSGRRLTCSVRVTNVWLEDGNGWAVQARFAKPVDPGEIDALLHSPIPSTV